MLKDIDQLKKALPDMKKLSGIEPELQTIRDERKKIQRDLDVTKELIAGKEEYIQQVKA